MSDEPPEPPLKPPSARQAELLRVIQGLAPDVRHTLRIVCRGTEPWEIQEIVEHRTLGDLRPRRDP
jgi:hypothetical protein